MTLTLSKHTAIVYSATELTRVNPTKIQVTVDEGWSPYIQASFDVPTATLTEPLDPRDGDRLTIRLHQAFGELVEMQQLTDAYGGDVAAVTAAHTPVSNKSITKAHSTPWNMFAQSEPLSYLTAAFSGDVSALTAAFGGLDVSAITKFMQPDNPSYNPQPSTVFEANLGIRAITRDYQTGMSTVQLASDEALLQDYAHTSATAYTPATSDVRTLVNYVLGLIGASLVTGTTTGTFGSDVKWTPGQSAWDFINPIVQKAGLALYCDENRKWYLINPTATAGALVLTDTSNVTELTASLDRSRDWFDACVIEYAWNNGTASQKSYDIHAPIGWSKVKKITYNDTPFPGTGAAQAIVERAQTRGYTYTVDAIANYDARPRQTLTVDVTGEPLLGAVTASITWSQPDDRMRVQVRDLEEI